MSGGKAVYGLLGRSLGHSFSRKFFTEKFLREGKDAEYVNFELPNIALLLDLLKNTPGLKGFNVTIPYKEAIMPYLDEIDETARRIGAVNVVKIGDDGRLKGYNTDVYGFAESLKPFLEPKRHRKALVLGCGGASRAVCHALRDFGMEVTRVSRRKGVGDLTYNELGEERVRENTIIVNATPVGMYPAVNEMLPIPYEGIREGHLCYDLIYNPLETKFLRKCKEGRAVCINGLEMLHLQAVRSAEIWEESFS